MHLEMHVEPEIENLRDTIGGRVRVELRDALGGHHGAGLVMHLEAEI
jgi:hypothetical protein